MVEEPPGPEAAATPPSARWRNIVIYNRVDGPLDIRLTRSADPASDLGARTLERWSTFDWGLRIREDVTVSASLEGAALGTTVAPFGSADHCYVVVDRDGLRTHLAAERRGPGEPGGINRVQVGCGPANLFPDWWNVDIRKFKGIDQAVDVTKDWPFRDLDFVYGEQFLEHLGLDGALDFLVAAGRSLRPGGVLRLTTPNIEWVLKTHYAQTDAEEDVILGTLGMNRAFHGWGHQFLYSPTFLRTLLLKVGYADVRLFDYGESDHAALANLERHGKFRYVDGSPSQVIVEARVDDPDAMTDAWRPFLHKHFLRYYLGGH